MGVGRTRQQWSWVLHRGLLHSCRWQPAYERLAQLRDTTVCIAFANADGSARITDADGYGYCYAECDTIGYAYTAPPNAKTAAYPASSPDSVGE